MFHIFAGTLCKGGEPRVTAGGATRSLFLAPLAKIPQKNTVFLREPYSGGKGGIVNAKGGSVARRGGAA